MTSEPLIQLQEIELLTSNPGPYGQSLQWRLRVDVAEQLTHPLTISFVWVGSARSSSYDQILDTFDVGPFVPGVSEFMLECDGPVVQAIPPEDVLGVTVCLVSFQYRGAEFLRVGYYVQIAYFDDELNANPPLNPVVEQLGRFMAMSQPAVTIIPIDWDCRPQVGS